MARTTGKQAALYVNNGGGWNYVADLYEWTAETELVLLDASIKGDNAERHMASHTRGRLSARRYIQVGGPAALGDFLTPGVRLDFAVVVRDPANVAGVADPTGFTGNTTAKVQGTGYVTQSRINAPRGLATDEWELQYDTVPVIT